MTEGKENVPVISSVDEPLKLIEFKRDDAEGEGKTTIRLVKETLDHIVKQTGDRKLCIICICGPSRQGKSFVLGHMVRCLECLEKDNADWMDWSNKTKPLKRFKFRSGMKPETQGIWVWSRPFHLKTEDGKDLSVLLIDTQGTLDEFTTHKEMSAIVGLSLLTSSVMIFNFVNNLQEDILCALNEYIEYGQLALDKEIGGTPFQKLVFLIRDWSNPSEFGYGTKGGKKFLEEKLRVKEGQAAEAVDVRKTIKKCFEDLDCYLMPYIGDKAIHKEFTGSIGELSPQFAKKLEEFITDLISNESLVIKKILGEQVTALELHTFMEKYVEVFNSDELPTAAQMWSASTKVNLINLVARAIKTYQDSIKKKQRGNNYLQETTLQKTHQTSKKQALEFFKKAKKFGPEETINEYADRLQDQIEKEFVAIKNQNDDKRKTFITQTMNECQTTYRNELEDGLPLVEENDTEFYEDKEIRKVADRAKSSALDEFQEEVAGDEEEDKIHSLVQTLEHTLESTLTSHINKNKLHRANAEKFMTSMVDDITSKYKNELNDRLLENKFIEFDELRGIRDTLRTSVVDSFKQTKKPGKKDFHAEYSTKLEQNLESAYSFLENKHKIELQQIQQDADNYIRERCKEYEALLRKIAGTVEIHEELEIKHQTKSNQIMGKFQSSVNPFPEGIHHRDVLQKKFENDLQGIFETVKREVLESQKRMAESYREAVKVALEYYSKQMKDTLDSYEDDFITDDDLQTEHVQVYKEALEQYEDYEKAGVPGNALDFKSDLMEQLDKRFETIQRESVQKCESAIKKTKNCVHECKNSYQKKMKKVMDTRNPDEFFEDHKLARKAVLEQFTSTCPVKDSNFQRPYLEQLKEYLEETFEKRKHILELKQTKEESSTKHYKNTLFRGPSEPERQNLHQQTVRFIMENLESMNLRGKLCDRCMGAIRKALTLGENRANGVIDVQPLDEINGAYDVHRTLNDTKLRRQQLETKKIIQSYKTQYTEQMENVLKNNPDGLAAKHFQNEHEEISNEVKKLMEIDIKKRIRADEPMEEHMNSLQSHIDKYWDVVLKENAKNWNKGQERLREAEKERKRLEAQRKFEGKGRSFSSGSNTEPGKSGKFAETGNPSLPPLVFQLGSTRVVMGMMVDGQPKVIGNEFKEPHTLAMVGLTNENKLIYGTEAVNLLDHEKQSGKSLVKAHWWIADCLICGEKAWTDNINIEGGFRKITVEFLIGFLLRKMKLAVESRFGGTCSTAVIAVPFWLSSTQRIQVKDGARVAGFSDVYLVNEASAAAYACATSGSRKEIASRLLVLSENSHHFDATVLEYSHYPTKITMIGHCGSYNIGDSKKRKGTIREGFSLITDALQFLYGASAGTTHHTAGVNEDTIRKLCRMALMYQAQSSQKHSMNDICSLKEALVICESATYRPSLENVGREQARRVGDINEDYAVITGAVLLGQAPKEIGHKIQDKIAFNLLRNCGAEHGIIVVDKSFPLPIINKTCTTTLPKFCKDAIFFQPAIDCVIPVGNLSSIKECFSNIHEIEPHLELSNEGIFTLKCILARRRKITGVANAEYLANSQYQWCTPNLSEEDLAKFASLLDLTQPSPPPASAVRSPQEDFSELTEARQDLLERCNEMMDWYAKNQESAFRSDLARELYTKKVKDAERFTEHPNTSVDDLKKQFDALDKYYKKYCAK